MKTNSKFSFVGFFFLASSALFGGIVSINSSMTYIGEEHGFIADNREFPAVLLLVIVFGLGWWFGNFEEYLILHASRRLVIFAFLGILVIYAAVGLSSILASGFAKHIIQSSSSMVLSGFLFRLSVIKSEVISKAWQPN